MNVNKHMEIIDMGKPQNAEQEIAIIGAGAIGSKVAMELAKLGFMHVDLYDRDVVDDNNVSNQLFGNQHIGMTKVEAVQSIINEFTGMPIQVFNRFVTDRDNLKCNVLVSCVDSMKTRRMLASTSHYDLFVDVRMDTTGGRVYFVRPNQIGRYLDTIYEDKPEQVSVCGVTQSLGVMSMYLTSMAVYGLIKHLTAPEDLKFEYITAPLSGVIAQ